MSHENALQKAVFEILSGDVALTAMLGEGGIFDRRLTGRPMPSLVIAEITTAAVGPAVEEHVLTLEAWSDAEGRRQVQAIAERVAAVLDDAAPTLDGAILVNLHHRSSRIRREPKTKAFVAEMVFRAVTE